MGITSYVILSTLGLLGLTVLAAVYVRRRALRRRYWRETGRQWRRPNPDVLRRWNQRAYWLTGPGAGHDRAGAR